jgi:phosphate transport system protein
MMRFREIYEIWRRDNSLNLALKESYEMLEKTHIMFRESVNLLRDVDTARMTLNIYEEDRGINAYQIQVRRRVLRYLAIAGMVDLVPGLVLTSIVIDIERIGDYTKNISELATTYPRKLDCGRFEQRVGHIEQIVEKLFGEIRSIVESSNRQAARRLIDECSRVRKDADQIIAELINGDDESMGRAQTAVVALYVRYLKRVGAHLLNILSSVVNPFERIGYREQDQT